MKVGDGNVKLGDVLKLNEELCVGGSAFGGDFTISCIDICNRGAITGSGCCKAGDGFERFILIGVIV